MVCSPDYVLHPEFKFSSTDKLPAGSRISCDSRCGIGSGIISGAIFLNSFGFVLAAAPNTKAGQYCPCGQKEIRYSAHGKVSLRS